MSLSDFFSLPERPWKNDGPLSVPQWAYCERLICVHDEYAERGWWHVLEYAEQLLFVEGGRIVESSLSDLDARVEEAVDQGYRPIVFVDGMRNWAFAMNALGRHQALGQVYAVGRDDEQMSELLHNPSEEIRAVARDGGRISVPNLDYGKALDMYLTAELEDFHVTQLDTGDPLKPVVELTCRLNPFRHLDVTLYCRNGVARLAQKYRTGRGLPDSDEPCDYPLRFQEWPLDFRSSNPLNTERLFNDPQVFMKAFAETFELPLAYQGWAPGGRTPWSSVLQGLHQMSRGSMAYLTSAHRALLSLIDVETLKQGLAGFESALSGSRSQPVRLRGVAGRREAKSEETEGHEFEARLGLLLRTTTSVGQAASADTEFEVIWLTKGKPAAAPNVEIEVGEAEEGQKPVTWKWHDDLQRLVLFDVKVGDSEIGWLWYPEKNILRISMRRSGHQR